LAAKWQCPVDALLVGMLTGLAGGFIGDASGWCRRKLRVNGIATPKTGVKGNLPISTTSFVEFVLLCIFLGFALVLTIENNVIMLIFVMQLKD